MTISQMIAVAVAMVGVMVLVGSFLFKKKRPARSGAFVFRSWSGRRSLNSNHK